MRNRKGERGNQTIEFTLVGVPIIFLLFSTANMSFSMLTLHTLQEAAEQGARYVSTRGSDCTTSTCAVTVAKIANVISNSAPGINAANLNLTLTSTAGSGSTQTCAPISSCTGTSTVWPPSGANTVGGDIVVQLDGAVTAPMFMYWGGSSAVKTTSPTTFHATSRQRIMY